jgi:sigma-B regulation protein RsbU (phosphoserine phosphatase)
MPKTLLVDDNPALRQLCSEIPHKGTGGEEFLFAANDAEAIEILTNTADLDVAIVSIDRPNISGMELFHKLEGRRVRVPRIALFESDDLELIRKAMNKGAADFLTKPVTAEDLIATIHKVHEQTEERRQAWRNEAELAALRREVDIAGDIQRRIIPNSFPDHPELDMAASLEPAKEMSGDFYDVFPIDRERIGIVMADVAGKGVPAAFFMAVARTLIRTIALSGTTPDACLDEANRVLCHHRIPAMFVSVIYAVLDLQSWQLEFSNGGHQPPLLVSAQQRSVQPLEGGKSVVLGVAEELPYKRTTVTMEPGDALVLYTDGITEAFNSEREQFSEERMIEVLAADREKEAAGMLSGLFGAVRRFVGEAGQSDDMTTLVLKRSS